MIIAIFGWQQLYAHLPIRTGFHRNPLSWRTTSLHVGPEILVWRRNGQEVGSSLLLSYTDFLIAIELPSVRHWRLEFAQSQQSIMARSILHVQICVRASLAMDSRNHCYTSDIIIGKLEKVDVCEEIMVIQAILEDRITYLFLLPLFLTLCALLSIRKYHHGWLALLISKWHPRRVASSHEGPWSHPRLQERL